MKYRIIHDGPRYIAQRRRWFGWQTLRIGNWWAMSFDVYTASPARFWTLTDAEDGIKTSIIAAGLARAHTRVAKSIPPWTTASGL